VASDAAGAADSEAAGVLLSGEVSAALSELLHAASMKAAVPILAAIKNLDLLAVAMFFLSIGRPTPPRYQVIHF
jgi:hypothetical protein